MACHAFDDSAHLQIPNDHLGVLAGARDEPVALADVNVRDEVEVPVQARLQRQRVPIPNLQYPVTKCQINPS